MQHFTHIGGKPTSWQVRCIEALKGNQSLPGCILIAALGKSTRANGLPRQPSLSHQCAVSSEGIVVAKFWDKDGFYHGFRPICRIQEIIDAFRQLADNLKLTDGERDELFTKLRQWVKWDHRPSPNEIPLTSKGGPLTWL